MTLKVKLKRRQIKWQLNKFIKLSVDMKIGKLSGNAKAEVKIELLSGI